MGVFKRFLNIYRPPTGAETADYFTNVEQQSPTIVAETAKTANMVYQTLVQGTGAVVKSPLTISRAILSAVGNVLALPTIALHYGAKGIDIVEKNVIDNTRNRIANVFGGRPQ